MRILTVHNRYLQRGGEDEAVASETLLLRDRGHQVTEYDVANEQEQSLQSWKTGLRAIWSMDDYRRVRSLVSRIRPDVVNVHNTFPLISPSVYYAAASEKVPIVQTLHNYRLLCPAATFFRDGHICEDCLQKPIAVPAVVHKCYRNNTAATAALTAMLAVHRLRGTWNEKVSQYVALSAFGREKFIQGGLPAEKLCVRPNFVYPDPGFSVAPGSYFVFVGRLTEDKGVEVLLNAWRYFRDPLPPLRIIGDGPLAAVVDAATKEMPNIEWLGRLGIKDTYQQVTQASALICPSLWYEGLPRTIVEAFAMGTPVIGSRIGVIEQMLHDRRTGLLFDVANPSSLAAAVSWVSANPTTMLDMRQQARKTYEEKYTADTYYATTMKIFEKVTRNR